MDWPTTRFPARHRVPEFTTFASLLRMATKYGFSDVREQLIEDLKSVYPTKWEDFEAGGVLGEDVFGLPHPHPNAVLNLFVTQNVRFAIPFAAYRASLGGFSSLMNSEPCAVLPRDILASTVNGMGITQRMMVHATYGLVYVRSLGICRERACVLNAGINSTERRAEALEKISEIMFSERKGGVLSAPLLGDLTCSKCTKEIEASCAKCRRSCWEILPSAFSVAKRWDEV